MDTVTNTPSERSNPASDIILNGRVGKAVWYLAWPTVINTVILTAYQLINRFFLGHLPDSEEALAASGYGGTVLMVQFAAVIGLTTGTSALVARFLGARHYEDADEATRQSLTLSVIAGLITGLPLIIWAKPLMELFGAQPQIVPLAASYTAIIAWFSIPLFIYMTIISALRSAGDVRTPLYTGAVVVGLNIIIDWLLIYGIGPFPKMGIIGAAIGTGLSRVAGMLMMIAFLKRSVLKGALDHFRTKIGWYARIMNIGWPATIQNILWTTASIAFLKVLSYLPNGQATNAVAAYTIALTIESVAFMPGLAFSMAAAPMVGQNLGAGRVDRAENSAWIATGQAALIMTLIAVLFVAIPGPLASVITNNEALIPLVVSYLIINAISEPFLAIGMVLRGALQGAGDVRVPMYVTLLTNWPIRLGLQYWLSLNLGYGASGAWAAMSASTIISGFMIMAWFKWGTWRTLQV